MSHFNSIVDPFNEFKLDPSKLFYLSFFWDKLDIEEHHEVLAIDLSGFLAAAGGNLGLALGYSCLSFSIFVAEYLFRKIMSY